jgi:hypothetical protein
VSYQPRRSAPAELESVPEVASGAPRRAAATWTDRALSRGGALAAGVSVVATAAAVAAATISGGVPAAAVAPATTPSASASVFGNSSALVADNVAVKKSLGFSIAAASAGGSAAAPAPVALAVSRQFTTTSLNVRAKADSSSKLLGHVSAGTQVDATSEISGDYRQVVYSDGLAWVLNDELTKIDPEAGVPSGTSMEPCSRGSAVENKLREATVFIYRSVCPLFPAVNSYGGWRAGGMQFHKNGRALDIMLTPGKESALGHRIANYLIAHATLFKIDHIIFEQHIWTPSTPHWRKMADRGSITANHFNHVHVAVVASAQ